jgi:hypothetical protein
VFTKKISTSLKGTVSRAGMGFCWHKRIDLQKAWKSIMPGFDSIFLDVFWIYRAINIFLASLNWLNNVSCLFLSFQLITSGVYLCIEKQVDWLAAGMALRVVGTVFVIFLRCWRTICTVVQPMESKGRCLKKCPIPSWPIRSKETWTKYTPT